jgi:serine protease Do
MRWAYLLAIAALVLFARGSASGQSVLTQLEQRLQGAGAAPAGPGAAPAEKGYLGAELDDENEQGKGVRVTKVKPGTPADTNGLRPEDLITAINGKAVKSVDDYDQLAKGPPGTKLQMTVERGGRPQLLTVTLGSRPADQNPGETPPPALSPPTTSPSAGTPSLIPPTGPSTPATPSAPAAADSGARGSGIRAPLDLPPPPESSPSAGPGSFPAPGASGTGGASLGITVEPFSDLTRGASIVPVKRGAVITGVRPGSPAEKAGLPLGAVIVSIDGRRVDSSDDLVSAIKAARPGQEVELSYYEGDRFGRKSIRLAAAGSAPGASNAGTAPGAPAPRSSFAEPPAPSFRAPPAYDTPPRGGGVNRPLLEKIEQMAGTLTRPTGTTTVYDPLAMAALQTRVVEMAEKMNALESRLKALESKLGVGGSAAPAPASAPTAPGFGSSPAPPITPGFGLPAGGTGTNP